MEDISSLGRCARKDTGPAREILGRVSRAGVTPNIRPVVVRINRWMCEDQLLNESATRLRMQETNTHIDRRIVLDVHTNREIDELVGRREVGSCCCVVLNK